MLKYDHVVFKHALPFKYLNTIFISFSALMLV